MFTDPLPSNTLPILVRVGSRGEKYVLDHVDKDAGVRTRQVEQELNISSMIFEWYCMNSSITLSIYN
jgi:hypothetical protein